ncbi:MAG: YesL family protein [Heyndrickxia sp.]
MSEQKNIIRFLETITNFAYLNILWFFFSLPVITIFPATTAMLQVIRKWSNDEEGSILENFFYFFKLDIKKGIVIGAIMTFILGALIGDFFIIMSLNNPWQSILLPLLIVISLLYVMISLYFPLLFIKSSGSIKHLMVMSFVLSIKRPFQPLVVLLFISLFMFITLYVRFFTILIIFSLCGWVLYKMINPLIERTLKI